MTPGSQSSAESRFAILIFTDLVGSTDLKARHGVPAYSAALRVHNDHFERSARACRGIHILQNMGDGYFAEAGSVVEAVRFALLFQEAMRAGPWGEVCLVTRLGIHAGEVSALEAEGGSGIVAPAADLAARVMSLALGGQILLTRFPFDEARHFLREHPPVAGRDLPALRWLAHGPYLLKGREEPMEIFEVGAEGLAPLVPPPDGEKAKRAIRPGEEETLGWRPAIGLEIPGRPGWRLTGKLGAGGFGEVWTGEHAKLHEPRAFKFCFDDERLRALKREVTLVRLLRTALGDRDDIVRFHELKLDEPPFYLESDLAPLGNLVQWAEKQGGLAAVPLAQRIALVAHTATALGAAHSIGVLHKDIKPTNILIFDVPDGGVRPRLVDFGIGTLADPAVLVQHGVTAAGFTHATIKHSTGTPTYSPPEYLAGKPYTVQGDIYGLGVLLYQLLTADAARPIAPGWERDIPDPLLREDIAACVDGDPARRLTSAAELANRLLKLNERREDREQAEAATQHAAASAARLARRKIQLRWAGVGLVLLAAAALTLTWSYQREKRQRQRAQQQTELAVAARNDAESLVRFMVFGLHSRLVKSADRQLVRDISLRVADYYRGLNVTDLGEPALIQYVNALNNVGETLLQEGEPQKAAELLNHSLEVLRERRLRDPSRLRLLTIHALVDLSDVERFQNHLASARSNLLDGLDLGRALVHDRPDVSDASQRLSVVLSRLVSLARREQNLPEAIRYQNEAIEISRSLSRKEPQNDELAADLCVDENNLAQLLALKGEHAAAILLAESSLAARRKLAQKNPTDATAVEGLLLGLSGLADRLIDAEQFTNAAPILREAISVADQVAARDPERPEWQRNRAIVRSQAGAVARETGDLAGARRAMEDSLQITQALALEKPDQSNRQADLASVLERVASVQKLQGDREAAITNQLQALVIHQTLAASHPDNPAAQTEIANSARQLSELYESSGEAGQATALRYARLEAESLANLKQLNRLLPAQEERVLQVAEQIHRLEANATGPAR